MLTIDQVVQFGDLMRLTTWISHSMNYRWELIPISMDTPPDCVRLD